MAVRILERADWERRLHKEKCKPSSLPNPLRTVEVWETENGSIFFVPMDNAHGRLRDEDLMQVLAQVQKLKPLDIND